MVTHAKRQGESFFLTQSLFENQIPANGIVENAGFLLQQRYDKSRRSEPVRPPQQRRHKSQSVPDRGKTPIPAPGQEWS
jgi:hypothetical protein